MEEITILNQTVDKIKWEENRIDFVLPRGVQWDAKWRNAIKKHLGAGWILRRAKLTPPSTWNNSWFYSVEAYKE